MQIAQITDLHLRSSLWGVCATNARRGRLMPTLFKQALGKIATQNVDLLVVTGDLLDVPTWLENPAPGLEVDDTNLWEQAALEDYKLVKSILDETGMEYMVLPGNHDYAKLMWQVFDKKAFQRQIAGYLITSFFDFEHDGHKPRRFNPQRSRWNESLNNNSNLPQVHLQHYVITPSFNSGYPHSYEEGEHMALQMVGSEAKGGGKIRLSLSGHYHKGTPLLSYGNTTFTTCPAFCEAPFPWRIYHLEEDKTPKITMQSYNLGKEAIEQKPVIYLDRDGVINDLASYNTGAEEMRLIPGSAEAIKKLQNAGYAVVGVTNQSCVGAGYVPDSIMQCVNDKMCRLLAGNDASLDAIYYSRHAKSRAVLPQYVGAGDSKPAITLLQRAKNELNLKWDNSWMAGDRISDIQTALNAGIKPILVRTGGGKEQEKLVKQQCLNVPIADDLNSAVKKILN